MYTRRVDSSALVFSLSSHRHSYIGLLFSSRYRLIINNNIFPSPPVLIRVTYLGPQFNRPAKDLVSKDLLTITFTQISNDRGMKTWCVSVSYRECVFCGKKYRYDEVSVECHMDPNIGKDTGAERTITEHRQKDFGCRSG